ncbi:MAG: hypothetical protein LBL66_01210 [Clostridiales bacterium]|jgi:hypothetical protein|nr:hypothetical protein [Clostridiales bacterium]
MLVNQIAVFLENRKGRLLELTETLGKAEIDLVTLSIADTGEYGILRAVTRDNEHAARVLKEAGFTVQVNSLIGVEVADAAGGLAHMLKTLSGEGIDIEYLYSFAHTKQGTAIILFRVGEQEKALDVLKKSGVKILQEIV